MTRSLLLLCAMLLAANALAGALYRSIDSEGKVHYSDKPLAGAEDVERLRKDVEPTPADELSYEAQKARQNFPVTLYVFEACGAPCTKARELLQKRGIPFAEKNLVTQEELDALRKASGSGQAPALSVGKTWLSGFQAELWHNELDVAGYPKSALYRRAVPSSPAK